jgi:hypothetical protein
MDAARSASQTILMAIAAAVGFFVIAPVVFLLVR